MDVIIHWGVFRRLRREIGAHGGILLTAIALDLVVLGVFTVIKLQSDPMIVYIALAGMAAVFLYERFYLSRWVAEPVSEDAHGHSHS